MDLEIVKTSAKCLQKEKDKYDMIMETKIRHMSLLVREAETDTETSRHLRFPRPGDGGGRRRDWKSGIIRCRLLYMEKQQPYCRAQGAVFSLLG